MKCHFKHPTDAPDSFVVKTWPDFELAPKEQIAGMFEKDIIAYTTQRNLYPRPQVYLADFDAAEDRWALLMDDANAFGTQKLHETEMTTEEVLHMVPNSLRLQSHGRAVTKARNPNRSTNSVSYIGLLRI